MTQSNLDNNANSVAVAAQSKLFTVLFWVLLFVMVALYLMGCSSGDKRNGHGVKGAAPVFYGLAIMAPSSGSQVSGTVWFSEAFGRVNVEVDVKGLKPNSKHGFHIHEFGNCSAVDASSAGGHYNPAGHDHGDRASEVRHAGDLGNLESDKAGRAKASFSVDQLSISGDLNPIIGRAVIIHKDADDLISQPTGGAGARIACGVIGAATRK